MKYPKVQEIKESIINELSRDNYKLTFKTDTPLEEIDPYGCHNNDLICAFGKLNKKKNLYFRMAVWNNGTTNFNACPLCSQGEIVSYKNNTNSFYFIEVSLVTMECRLVGCERRYYINTGTIVQKSPYKFKIAY